jgi:hypothetical protein
VGTQQAAFRCNRRVASAAQHRVSSNGGRDAVHGRSAGQQPGRLTGAAGEVEGRCPKAVLLLEGLDDVADWKGVGGPAAKGGVKRL